MPNDELKAIVVNNEFNLDKIAAHFGINKKYKWEDTLVLDAKALEQMGLDSREKQLRIFPFGSVVFVNFRPEEMKTTLLYLKQVDKNVSNVFPAEYSDEYRIMVDSAAAPAVTNDYMMVATGHEYMREIAAVILAKSVALDRIEVSIDKLLDDVEEIVGFLEKGKLGTSDARLGKISAKILGFKLDTISYVMLLDKPAITWSNNFAAELYDELSVIFELSDRYANTRHKVDTLMDITEVFSSLVHARRGAKLEWGIIILIVIEIVLQVSDKLTK
jgi:uncharacterized Rmd1/YagE family protein